MEWAAIPVDVGMVDALLDGWDPDAEEQLMRTVEGKFRGVLT